MRLLLDTHVFLWAFNLPQKLPQHITQMIIDPNNEVSISVASIWEIAIKRPLGRMNSPSMSADDVVKLSLASDFKILDITAFHAVVVENLPLLHGDPFDRLIVAQALAEPLRLITHDGQLAAYSDTIITW